MEITVNIHGLDSLAQAIAAMAQAIERGQGGASTVAAASATQAPVVPHASAPAPATETTAPAASAPTASEPIAPAAPPTPVPAVPAAPAAPAVPLATAPQQYTLAELQKAVMPLLDAGRMADLQQVLAKYGVQDLTRVPAEQYGALAADFRALGARL